MFFVPAHGSSLQRRLGPPPDSPPNALPARPSAAAPPSIPPDADILPVARSSPLAPAPVLPPPHIAVPHAPARPAPIRPRPGRTRTPAARSGPTRQSARFEPPTPSAASRTAHLPPQTPIPPADFLAAPPCPTCCCCLSLSVCEVRPFRHRDVASRQSQPQTLPHCPRLSIPLSCILSPEPVPLRLQQLPNPPAANGLVNVFGLAYDPTRRAFPSDGPTPALPASHA